MAQACGVSRPLKNFRCRLAFVLLLVLSCEPAVARRQQLGLGNHAGNGSAPAQRAAAAHAHQSQPHGNVGASHESAQQHVLPPPPRPPHGRSQAVVKLLVDSFKMLKGSARPPPPPRSSPPADCAKHPGLCQPATCEVWRPDVQDKCRYVRMKDACGADDQYIPYLEVFYCASGGRLWLVVSAWLVVWLLLLFYAMSVVAEVFLCPAVQYISERLRLPPDIAGVTLLAFASSAPDIFTQIAAIDGGQKVELELAVSSVMGSGLFIVCVSLAGVLFVKGIDVTDRTAFIRDVAAYLAASGVTLVLLWDGQFARSEAVVLLLLYVVYLGVCIYTSRGSAPVTAQHRHAPLPTSSPRAGARQLPGLELQPQRNPLAGGLNPPGGLPSGTGFATFTVGGEACGAAGGRSPRPSRLLEAGGPFKSVAAGRRLDFGNHPAGGQNPKSPPHGLARASMLRRGPDGSSPPRGRPAAGAAAVALQRSNIACRRGGPPAEPPAQNVGDSSPLPVSTDLEYPVAAAAVAAVLWSPDSGLQHPAAMAAQPGEAPPLTWHDSCGSGGLAKLRSAMGGTAWRAAAAVRAICAERLHLGGSWAVNCMVVATAPLVLLMHTTMPAVGRGHCSQQHCLVLAAAAPAYLLLVGGGLRLGLPAFGLLWAASAAGLYALMHLAFLKGAGGAPKPKANAVFAALAFVQSAAWLGTIADEVVAVLNGGGAILGIEEDLLGATVLAWGETLPDLVAMLAVARAGQGTMAVAACFGGPVLNLLVGTGAPVLGASFKHGVLPFRLSAGITALFLETMVLCAALLVLVPTICGWALARRVAWLLLGVYIGFQFLFLAAEQHWLFS